MDIGLKYMYEFWQGNLIDYTHLNSTAFCDIAPFRITGMHLPDFWCVVNSSPWWWWQNVPLKRRATPRLHGAISRKADIYILAAVRTWNLILEFDAIKGVLSFPAQNSTLFLRTLLSGHSHAYSSISRLDSVSVNIFADAYLRMVTWSGGKFSYHSEIVIFPL
jgi:hypothetical protein